MTQPLVLYPSKHTSFYTSHLIGLFHHKNLLIHHKLVNYTCKSIIQSIIFVVSNFNEKEVLKKEVEYDVDVTPTENTTVKVYKNSSNDNLLTEDDLLIENNKFKAKKKTEDTYKVVITAKKKPTETEKITLKINS